MNSLSSLTHEQLVSTVNRALDSDAAAASIYERNLRVPVARIGVYPKRRRHDSLAGLPAKTEATADAAPAYDPSYADFFRHSDQIAI
ncbi:hypothetical protein EDF46_0072 [Frondihabitans sp. PhB188]|uniref:hypothetical protein n=1 Tax=Frondihabitans sp. PhB188 TaxID=2485200 RepID=UPI000F47393C|nr:hypothetical protein [Frondihabitans sp. PhB188]ROQ40712.1 hypothetical protein EDF46_0072 [Frondihabitans sp. PhB188]